MAKREADGLISEERSSKIRRLYDRGSRASAASGLTSGDSSEDEIPYVDPGPSVRPDPGARRREHDAKMQSELSARLKSLPPDVREEYLGPNFDFERGGLNPYEQRDAMDFLDRISCREDDIPDLVVQIHPDLFISIDKFKGFADCVQNTSKVPDFSEDLWKRNMLVEAPPYRSDNAARGTCKRQQALLEAKLDKNGLPDLAIRRLARSPYLPTKFVDSRTYMTLKQMFFSLDKEKLNPSEPLAPISRHFSYLKFASKISDTELNQARSHNNQNANRAFNPEIIARKGKHTFISGKLMQQSRELLNANLFELHGDEQIQLMNHFPNGIPTGEYKSLLTHAKGRFQFPSKAQTEQLGLPPNFQYKKEADFEERYLHRSHFFEAMGCDSGANHADKGKHEFMFRKVDFAALLDSDYHKVRLAISLIEDDRPFDIERCNKIREYLKLDDRLRHPELPVERVRERSAGR